MNETKACPSASGVLNNTPSQTIVVLYLFKVKPYAYIADEADRSEWKLVNAYMGLLSTQIQLDGPISE